MSYGVPAIVSREAGIVDLITQRDSGWGLAADLSDVAEALVTLQRDTPLAAHIAEVASIVAASRTWDDVARETLKTYDEVVSS